MSEQQYRMLEHAKGDVLQEGDEMLMGRDEWDLIASRFIGDRVYLDGAFRRPVAQEQKPDHTEGGKYRMLGDEDTIEFGDEFLFNACWYPVEPSGVGHGVLPLAVGRFRRPVAQEQKSALSGTIVNTDAPADFISSLSAAIDELVRKVFGAEPVYADSLSQKEIMKALVEEDIAQRDMTSNHQKFVDPHGVFVEPKLEIPDGLPPLPPVPEGYDRWVYRGLGWKPGRHAVFGCVADDDEDWGENDPRWATPCRPLGVPNTHYIEAVKDDTQPPPTNPTRDEILQNLDRIINQGADSDVRSGYYPDALWLEEARQMIFKLEQDRRRLHSTLTQAFRYGFDLTLRVTTTTLLKSIKP